MKSCLIAAGLTYVAASYDQFKAKVESFGFLSERYEIKTNDAYILTLGRIRPLEP